MKNPLKSIMDIRRDELPLALLMYAYFFLVITSFWILKPIKKTLFIGYYKDTEVDIFGWLLAGSQAELLAKILNMIVAFVAVAVFTWLARRFRREQLTVILSVFFMVCYVLYYFAIKQPGELTVWTFYLFGDLFSTLMVATFFAFLNDSVTPGKAKRLYGLVGSGGVMGGAFGSLAVALWITRLDMTAWLWVTFGIAIAIIIVALTAGRLVSKNPPDTADPEPPENSKSDEKVPNAAVEGAKLVFASKYLLAIVAIVGLYEITSTIVDFQFTATIEHYVEKDNIARHFSTVFTITNFAAMFVQLFLTSYIMTRFGLTVALMVLPVSIFFASVGFAAIPLLWVGSLLNTADNGFSYSINQSSKEALYVPTTRDEKYKAKAFIDMFVQRVAKTIAVVTSLTITSVLSEFSSIRWLSFITIAIVLVWIFAVRYAGRKFNEITASSKTP
jgi:AAA family ATP:ADP antiporter